MPFGISEEDRKTLNYIKEQITIYRELVEKAIENTETVKKHHEIAEKIESSVNSYIKELEKHEENIRFGEENIKRLEEILSSRKRELDKYEKEIAVNIKKINENLDNILKSHQNVLELEKRIFKERDDHED